MTISERDEVVDLVEADLLALQLLVDRPEALDAALDPDDRNLRLGELGLEPGAQLLDEPLARLALGVDRRAQGLVGGRLEVPERQFLELVLDFAHPEPMGNRGVDVARLLGDPDPAVLRQ